MLGNFIAKNSDIASIPILIQKLLLSPNLTTLLIKQDPETSPCVRWIVFFVWHCMTQPSLQDT